LDELVLDTVDELVLDTVDDEVEDEIELVVTEAVLQSKNTDVNYSFY
jgi:hypothetical protein